MKTWIDLFVLVLVTIICVVVEFGIFVPAVLFYRGKYLKMCSLTSLCIAMYLRNEHVYFVIGN